MKSNLFLIAIFGLTIFFFASCNQEDNNSFVDQPISFSSMVAGEQVDPQTRVIGSSWSKNDAIGVFMKKAGSELSLENVLNNANNIKYLTPNGNQYFNPANTSQNIYFPENGEAVDFISYYPFQENLNNYIYKIDITNQNSQEAIDLLYSNNAINQSKESFKVDLSFSHQLIKLKFNITTNDKIKSLDGLTVTIYQIPTKADFELATGKIIIDDTSITNIECKTIITGVTATSEAIIIPIISGNLPSVTFKLPSGEKFTYQFPSSIKFEQGNSYTYDIVLKGNGGSVQPNYGWFETPVKKSIDNTVFISHNLTSRNARNYSMLYDTKNRMAYWVAYPLHSFYLGDSGRSDEWQYDPQITYDYQPFLEKGFGINNIDRGHQIPSGDRTYNRAENATTFYYSNMTAQHSRLNQGIWANLENKIRTWTKSCDTMYVVTGAMITSKYDTTIEYVKDNAGKNVAKPKYYFKALAQKVGTNYYTIAYKMDNDQPQSSSFDSYRLTVKDLEEETGFTFFPNLNNEKEKIESSRWQ